MTLLLPRDDLILGRVRGKQTPLSKQYFATRISKSVCYAYNSLKSVVSTLYIYKTYILLTCFTSSQALLNLLHVHIKGDSIQIGFIMTWSHKWQKYNLSALSVRSIRSFVPPTSSLALPPFLALIFDQMMFQN